MSRANASSIALRACQRCSTFASSTHACRPAALASRLKTVPPSSWASAADGRERRLLPLAHPARDRGPEVARLAGEVGGRALADPRELEVLAEGLDVERRRQRRVVLGRAPGARTRAAASARAPGATRARATRAPRARPARGRGSRRGRTSRRSSAGWPARRTSARAGATGARARARSGSGGSRPPRPTACARTRPPSRRGTPRAARAPPRPRRRGASRGARRTTSTATRPRPRLYLSPRARGDLRRDGGRCRGARAARARHSPRRPTVESFDFGGFRNVLPGGQGETVNAPEFAAFQAGGERPTTFIDQLPLYDGPGPGRAEPHGGGPRQVLQERRVRHRQHAARVDPAARRRRSTATPTTCRRCSARRAPTRCSAPATRPRRTACS